MTQSDVRPTGDRRSLVLVLLFVALWFILWGDLFHVLPCVILFLCFSVLLALRLPHLGKRELILVLFVCLFDLRLFGFVCFLFLLVSGKGCGLWLLHYLDFSLTLFWSLLGPATFFCGDWSWNIFYGHSLLSADASRAVVSFWQKKCTSTD